MHYILLSGGSGRRLWPLSNEILSKQFIRAFRAADGSFCSMIQQVYHQIAQADSEAHITIATSKAQVSVIHNQLGRNVSISVEPSRRDTFPAIVLSAAYLHDIKGVALDEAIVVCPVDPYAQQEYFDMLKLMGEQAQRNEENIILMGIDPTYPSEKYGYIIPQSKQFISGVKAFCEKPDAAAATEYIAQGALWNGGVFAFRLGYLLEKAREMVGFTGYLELQSKYDTLKKTSFDYAVVEKEKRIAAMRYHGVWKDLGTWNTFTEEMTESTIGTVICNEHCHNLNVINQLSMPILCMGLRDMIVAASPQGIIISDKEQSSYIKPYVESIEQQVMFAEKSWGQYLVIDVGAESLTVKITLKPKCGMQYHRHARRDEVWTIVSGKGHVIIDGEERPVTVGDTVGIPAQCGHTIIADTQMQIIEVQMGSNIDVLDKEKIDWEYRKASSNL